MEFENADIVAFDELGCESIKKLEPILRAAMQIQKQNPDFVFTDAQKAEFLLMQEMLRCGRFDGNTRFWDYPSKNFDTLLPLLVHAEEVIDANTGEIFVIMDNVNVDDELEGYIYVFDYDDSYTHEGRSIQYKCHKNVVPIDVVSIKFKDFKKYYSINIDKHNKTL